MNSIEYILKPSSPRLIKGATELSTRTLMTPPNLPSYNPMCQQTVSTSSSTRQEPSPLPAAPKPASFLRRYSLASPTSWPPPGDILHMQLLASSSCPWPTSWLDLLLCPASSFCPWLLLKEVWRPPASSCPDPAPASSASPLSIPSYVSTPVQTIKLL